MVGMNRMALGAMLGIVSMLPLAGDAAESGKGVTGPEVVEILQKEGYRALLEKDKDGDPKISTRMGGVNAYVHFYDCKAGRCGSLQFVVGLDLENGTTLQVANKFNQDYRYAHIYLDDESDPFLQFDFEVLNASPEPHIVSQIDMWEDLLNRFMLATGYRDDGKDEDATEAAPVEDPTKRK